MNIHIRLESSLVSPTLGQTRTNVCLVCDTVQLTYGIEKSEVRYLVKHEIGGLVCAGSHQAR